MNKYVNRIWRKFWLLVWNTSEFIGIGLGRFAPWVFKQIIECSDFELVKADDEREEGEDD